MFVLRPSAAFLRLMRKEGILSFFAEYNHRFWKKDESEA
jgi:hypothetical protein